MCYLGIVKVHLELLAGAPLWSPRLSSPFVVRLAVPPRACVARRSVMFWCFGIRWELTVFRQSERYPIKVVYQARPAVALSDSLDPIGYHAAHRT